MKTNKCLLVIDLQQDFCTGGSLAVPESDTIIPIINELLTKFDLIIFTKDWHDPKMNGFASQHPEKNPFDKYVNAQGEEDTLWPDHCVANTPGAEFHPSLDLGKCAKDFYIFKKGLKKNYHPYSGFSKTNLEKFLNERKITDVYTVGLAGDFCVCDTAIDSVMAGFNTFFIINAIKFIGDKNKTLASLYEANVKVIESYELNFLSI